MTEEERIGRSPNSHGNGKRAPLPEGHPQKRQQRVSQAAWLFEFKKTGTILGACHALGIARATVQRWRKNVQFEARFQQAFAEADHQITERLELSAMEKALRPDGTVMNIFLLKARRPKIYNDRLRVEHANAGFTLADFLLGKTARDTKDPGTPPAADSK